MAAELSICEFPFVCPRDRTPLSHQPDGLHCPDCATRYPLVRGIPVLIDDDTSVFSRADYVAQTAYAGASYGAAPDRTGGLRGLYRRAVSTIAETGVSISPLSSETIVKRIAAERPGARILVIGAGERDFGVPGVVYTDVALSSLAHCVCDAHSLAFPDGWFDGVLAVSVLEHVADPYRCVDEIHRVLKDDGLVYAVTPFLQPVHMGAHDFTRFTYLGHRRLFRRFEDVQSGCSQGPGTTAAYVLPHLLLCLSDARWARRVAKLAGLMTGAVLKHLDRLIGRRAGSYDAAAGVFFYGRKSTGVLSDRDLIRLYRGAQK